MENREEIKVSTITGGEFDKLRKPKKRKKGKITYRTMTAYLSVVMGCTITKNLVSGNFFNFNNKLEKVMTSFSCILFFSVLIWVACSCLVSASDEIANKDN